FLSFGFASLANDKPCTLHDSGNYYDINPLKASKDYEFTTDNGHKFYLNVCRGVTTDSWNTGVPESDGDIAGLIRRDHGDFAIGIVNTTLEMKQGGLILRQSNGSPCTGMDNKRGSSTIRFICDTSVYAAGKPVLLDQWPSDDEKACHYELEWRTHFACPTGERGFVSGLFVFNVIAVMILVMSYIVISTLYNRFVLRLRGYDQMPNFSLSHAIEIAEVCCDFFRSSWDSLCSRSSSWRSRGQGQLNPASHHWTSREEEEAMIASDPLEPESQDVQDREFGDAVARGGPRPQGSET
ncbi:mannose-6-phosphate receptor binding domain-containing protein, partial [Phlebopus sp. FC_14]